jgi:hypothetical protein
MATPRALQILKQFYISYAVGAGALYLILMAFVFPWWHASNHPVILTLGAPKAAEMNLAFKEDGESVPIAPLGEVEPYHWYWATELPARPHYELALQFPKGTGGEWVLSEIKLITLSPQRTEVSVDLMTLLDNQPDGIQIRRLENGWGIIAEAGTRLALPNPLPPPSIGQWTASWFSATIGYILVVGIALLMLGTALRFPDGIRACKHYIHPLETGCLILCLLAGAWVHLYLVGNSMPDYWPADSTSYAMKAVSLVTEFSYDTGTHEYELNRMPGFPVFMAVIFKLFGWDLKAVAMAQAALFSISIVCLSLSVRKLLHGWLIGPVALAALISPAAIWASRQIATESTFASAWILSIAAFLYLWQRSGAKRLVGWVLFGLATTAAVAIRPNGILLFCLPGFMVTGTIWWAWSFRGKTFWKMPFLWQTIGHVAIPSIMVVVFLGAWSVRNQISRGYPKPTDLTEIVWANAPFFAGIFDIRAAKNDEELTWFVNERQNSGYWFHGWSLRKYRFREITNQYQNIEDSSILELEQELAEFNRVSDKLIPLRAKLVGWGRVANWGLFFPRINAHTTDPLNQNYKVLSKFPNENRAEHVRKNLKWATRTVDKEIKIEEAISNIWVVRYNATLVPLYPLVYRFLFLAALFGWLVAMSERKYLAAAFITPYLLNIFLNVYFMYIIGRYVQVLDASLWMAALAGLACISPKALQEPTTETDRRCIPPIRPKRLLTRFATEPGIPR